MVARTILLLAALATAGCRSQVVPSAEELEACARVCRESGHTMARFGQNCGCVCSSDELPRYAPAQLGDAGPP